MSKILGVNEVGVAELNNGTYVCWNSSNGRWFTSRNINEAQCIVGNKELNFERIMDMYRANTHDMSEATLVVKPYVYFSEIEASCFVETLPNVAVLYNYMEV